MRSQVSKNTTSWARRFGGSRRGSTAVEFAIVAIPFIFLLLGALELSLVFVANASLQNATFAAARQIRVGELMAPGAGQNTSNGAQIDLADFKTKICKAMPLAGSDCSSRLFIDIRELQNFTGSMAADPYSGKTLDVSKFCFYSGASSSVVQMRAYYLWPVFTPLLLDGLINTDTVVSGSGSASGQWFALSAHEVFRNEPGSSQGNTGATC